MNRLTILLLVVASCAACGGQSVLEAAGPTTTVELTVSTSTVPPPTSITMAISPTTTVSAGSVSGWVRLPHDEAVFGGGWSQEMRSAVAVGSGLVAVGSNESGSDHSGGDWDAAVWTSPDGLTWTRVPHDEAVFGGTRDIPQGMLSVAAVDAGLVAVGHDTFDAAVWYWTPDEQP